MNTHVIITKKAGHDIPRPYLQLVMQRFPSCYGIALQDHEPDKELGDKLVLDVAKEYKSASLEDMTKLLEGCKDVQAMLVFGNLVNNFDKDEDIQPFVFQQKEGDGHQNILAMAIEGDFPNYAQTDSGHTDEYNFWEEFVFPTLCDKHEAAGDLDVFFEKVKSSQFQQAVLNPAGHRGCVVMLPLIGDTIAFNRNELGADFEWGSTTQSLGWGKPSVVEKAAEAVATVGRSAGRLARLMGGSAVSAPSEPAHVVDDKGIHHTKPPAEAPKTTDNGEFTEIMVPRKLQGNARNAWIRLMLGLTRDAPMPPAHSSQSFKVKVPKHLVPYAMEDVSTRDNVRDLGERMRAGKAVAISSGMKEAEKVTAPDKPAAEPTVQDPKKVGNGAAAPMDYLPELKADDKKGAVELVTDWATQPDGKRPSALDIQRMEAKWPLFTTMMGIQPINYTRWTIKEVKELGKKHPDALALAFIEMRKIAHDHGAFAEDTSTKQVEVPQAQPAPVTAKPAETGTKKSRLERLKIAG